jgi:predicted N-acyltransferase
MESELVGIAISQFLDLNKLESFGERDKCVKTAVRNFVFKNFCSHVLFVGNNMLTGKNGYAFSKKIGETQVVKTLQMASISIRKELKLAGKNIHITTFKDLYSEDIKEFTIPEFKKLYQFSTQPNMIFKIESNWKTENDYVDSLTKKYRDQYKRARKKAEGIEKRKMHLEDIIKHEDVIYDLYFHVAKNAPFNTFFLPKNHFRVFKEQLKDQFLFYGYFLNEQLIGFNTLIKNGKIMETYFLGYDDTIQREKMLYLNMLYDMVAYSINKNFEKIIFGRTALEIKSSVGAKPVETFGYIEHSSAIINSKMETLFCYLEPKTDWKERNPFK